MYKGWDFNKIIVLYCIVLYCIVLYCIVLYCIVLLSKFWNVFNNLDSFELNKEWVTGTIEWYSFVDRIINTDLF